MKLGSSIGRRRPVRRGGRKRRSRRSRRRRSRGARPRRVFRLALRGALLLAAAFAVGYLGATRLVFPVPAPPPELLGVPDAGGVDLAEAQGRVESAGLVLGAIDSLYHPAAPVGAVLGQSPLPGQLAVPGTAVELAVSLGPEERAVPAMVGQRVERARILLGANGFSVVVDSVEGDQPAGEVVAMEPVAGTTLNLPSEVRVAISLGPPMVEMPLLLGLREEDAVFLLDALGLFVTEIEQEPRPEVEEDVVIEQEPAAGTMVEVGADVALALGPGETPPPAGPPPGHPDMAGTIVYSATMRSVVPYVVRPDRSVRASGVP